MKRFILLTLTLVAMAGYAQDRIYLSGRVRDAVSKADLTNAILLTYDTQGNVVDTLKANQGRTWNRYGSDTLAVFYKAVPRVDSTYVFDVLCEGYKDQTVSFPLKITNNRIREVEIPTIYMERAPRQLKEMTVTTSKIKFYNKGDTVVYNADAFQLAEGSMLDALIAQLPGAELNTNGQIKINGEFVESLLLNGKEFFDSNNNIMLENIAAYTVKDIKVYESQTLKDQRMNNVAAPKVLTMNVQLKKEYNMGWIINAQGGYGTDDRYIGRLFANWFNSTTRVTVVGNVNNLNDNRTPGKTDTWTPDQMPSGTKEYRSAGIDYNYTDVDETKEFSGDVSFGQTVDKVDRTTYTTNFLPGGNNYQDVFAHNNNSDWGIRTSHGASFKTKSFSEGIYVSGSYNRTKSVGTNLSGTFNEEPEEMDESILDALYSGSPELLKKVVNRSRTATDSRYSNYRISASPYMSYRNPNTQDYLNVGMSVGYSGMKQDLWNDYEVNYGDNPTPAVRRRRYTSAEPNHTLYLNANAAYIASVGKVMLQLRYNYMFSNTVKDQNMYALERLDDMGIFGVIPEGYLGTLDPENSFQSRTIESTHTISPFINYSSSQNKNGWLMVRFGPDIKFSHRNFNYFTNGRNLHLSKDFTTLTFSSIWSAMVEYQFYGKEMQQRYRYANSLRYSYRITPTLPDMSDMIDVMLDSDPLNIYVGNPDLHTQNAHSHLIRWSYTPFGRTFYNEFYLGYIHTSGALTRGYTYDTATGQRINKMYNVDGNHRAAITNELSWQFGPRKQYTLASTSDAAFSTLHDMIGINLSEPVKTNVHNRVLTQKLKFSWQIGQQSLSLRADYTNRRTSSTQEGFNAFNAHHFNYGVSGVFKLPAGFGASTDFTCYMRRGYGVENLDTTDPIWNLRVTYAPPRNSHWVFMVDGFDLLHKLNNVDYTINEAGRMVSYTNALPRYVLFSVQYRLNIQPKKR